MTIVDLIPSGKECAIKRGDLAMIATHAGLIDKNVLDKDRAMRLLVEQARRTTAILSSENGGYYLPTRADLNDWKLHLKREENRAKSIFRNLKFERKLYNDFVHEREDLEHEHNLYI